MIAITPDRETTAWAAREIELGGGSTFRVHVIGPDGIPIVTDAEQATREPHLAMISLMAHGRGDPITAAAIALAATAGIQHLPDDKRMIYSAIVETSLGAAARKAFEMRLEIPPALHQQLLGSKFYQMYLELQRREAKGKAQGVAESVLQILAAREIAVTDEQRQRILACSDLKTLERWLIGALTVAATDELIGIA